MPTEETDAPPAHPGVHYDNPETKALLGPTPAADRSSVQRVVWPLFLLVVLGGIALAIAFHLTMGS